MKSRKGAKNMWKRVRCHCRNCGKEFTVYGTNARVVCLRCLPKARKRHLFPNSKGPRLLGCLNVDVPYVLKWLMNSLPCPVVETEKEESQKAEAQEAKVA